MTGHDIGTVQACFSFNCPFVQVGRDNGSWGFLLTWWVQGLRITLKAAVPWLVFISLCYLVWRRVGSPKVPDGALQDG